MPIGKSRPAFGWLMTIGSLMAIGSGSGTGSTLRAQEGGTPAPWVLLEEAITQGVAGAEKSVVSIARDRVTHELRTDIGFLDGIGGRMDLSNVRDPKYIPSDFGAGVILREDGYILTNYHLVRGGPTVTQDGPAENVLYVRLADRRGYFARIYAADPRSDLALLKIDVPDKLPVMKWSAGKPLRKGQFVLLLGNPYAISRDGSASVCAGLVSNVTRTPQPLERSMDWDESSSRTIEHLGTLVHLDMRLNLGTSGGALLNLNGELVGLTTSLAAIAGYEKSAGFAVPLDQSTMRIVKSLQDGLEVEYGFLGIELDEAENFDPTRSELLLQHFQQSGAAHVKIVPYNGPAFRAGLMKDDLILAVNDQPVLSSDDLMREIGLLAPGTLAELKVFRPSDGTGGNGMLQARRMSVEMGKWPVRNDSEIVAPNRRHPFWRGLAVDYATARFRFFNAQRGAVPGGVLVTEVKPESAAAKIELAAGDFITHVNRQPVQTPREFYTIASQLTAGEVKLTLTTGKTVTISP